MDYKVLYRKYRPDSFKGIISQDYAMNMLKNAITHNKISHAYIFTGPRGTGKTSTAKIFAKAINCEHPNDGEPCGECNSCKTFVHNSDIIEIDAASNNGVDEIRELINNIKISPANSKYKIYIIDEVHMMTQSAFNALLLTLEEPPAHVIFILATTNIESVPITILSRCQRFDFKKIDMDGLKYGINFVCKEENISITPEAVEEIAYMSEGGLRDAFSLLDQLSSSGKEITIDNILSNYGSISTVFIKEIVKNLLDGNLNLISNSLNEIKNTAADYKIFLKKLIQELVELAIKSKCNQVKYALDYEEIKNLIFELNDCMNRTNININPFILIELVLLGAIKEEKYIDLKQKNDLKVEKPIKESNIVAEPKIEICKEIESFETDISINSKADLIENIEEDNVIEDATPLLNHFTDVTEIKKVRINNCFFGAKKDILNQLKTQWKEIASDIEIEDDIKSLLIDSNLVASSEEVAIISTSLASTASLINNRLAEISAILSEFFDQEMKFIALIDDEWIDEKHKYVNNIKMGIHYELMEEPEEKIELVDNGIEESIEKIAQNLFDSDKIEII